MRKKTQAQLVEMNEQILGELLDDMRDPPLSDFMRFVFSPEGLLDEFLESPGSRRNHHSFRGGLAFHSIQAAKLARSIARHYNSLNIKVNEDLVVAGTLLHDIGKIHCYEWKEMWTTKSGGDITVHEAGYYHIPRASLFHHIPMGYLDIAKLAEKFNNTREREEHKLVQKKVDKLLHIILSHHGRRAWSSPVLPQFVEAYIVHAVEMMDGYVDKFNDGKVPDTIYDGTNY
jgi:3'-5' exoribonuclease